MRCLYCHNPDTWEMGSGKQMTSSEILKEYDNIKTIISNGGITATGGEPLMQLDFLTELFTKAHEKGIHTCIDTSGIVFNKNDSELVKKFDILMNVTDLVMLDIKHIDNQEHKKLTGHSNKRILEFLKYLEDKNIDTWIRHVVVRDITLNDEYLYKLGYEIGRYKNIKALDILPYHDMAKAKYESLGKEYPLGDLEPTTKEEAKHAREVVLNGMRARRAEM